MKQYTKEKREELIWALCLQDYSLIDIGEIFNIDRSSVLRIKRKTPTNYTPKWKKVQQ